MKINPKIFKTYDIRGVYPNEINSDVTYAIGRALANFFSENDIIIGRDARNSSDALFDALVEGIRDENKNVINIGVVATEVLYFAVGKNKLPGLMITASHLTGEYNGIKVCSADVIPIGKENGLLKVKEIIEKISFNEKKEKGNIKKQDFLVEYIEHILGFTELNNIKPLSIVADAGNGVGGKSLSLMFEKISCRVKSLYFNPDGNFPNHPADPLVEENLKNLQNEIKKNEADFGLALDGDGDRIFFVDENSQIIPGSFIVAVLAEKLLKDKPNSKIVYNAVCSKIVPEVIIRNGGEPIQERVGHIFMKSKLKETNAIFGGEHSGHYYFKYNFGAESSVLVLLLMLEVISKADKTLSEIIKPYQKYSRIPEKNFKVEDKTKILQKIEEYYKKRKEAAEISYLDGLTVGFNDWWFNLRPSNTEPYLRLNMEAENEDLLKEKLNKLKKLIV